MRKLKRPSEFMKSSMNLRERSDIVFNELYRIHVMFELESNFYFYNYFMSLRAVGLIPYFSQ